MIIEVRAKTAMLLRMRLHFYESGYAKQKVWS